MKPKEARAASVQPAQGKDAAMNESYRNSRSGYIKVTDATLRQIIARGLAEDSTPFADIARLIEDSGADTILLEDPCASPLSMKCAKSVISTVSHASVCLCVRPDTESIKKASALLSGTKRARIALSANNPDKILIPLIKEAKELSLGVTVALGGYADVFDSLPERINRLSAIGVDSFIIFCTSGDELPNEISEAFTKALTSVNDVDISIGALFDDRNKLALPNSIAAISAGVTEIVCAVGGIGICSTFELSAFLEKRRDAVGVLCNINPRTVEKLSEILRISVGIDSLPQNLEERTDSPKISSRPALARRAVYLGYELDDKTLNAAYAKVRELSARKETIHDTDIRAIIHEVTSSGRYTLDSYQLQCGSGILSMAAVKVKDTETGSTICQSAASDLGAVGAVISALTSEKLFPTAKILSHSSQSIGSGPDAVVGASVTLEINGTIVTGRAFSYDTVTAAAKAFLAGVNSTEQ